MIVKMSKCRWNYMQHIFWEDLHPRFNKNGMSTNRKIYREPIYSYPSMSDYSAKNNFPVKSNNDVKNNFPVNPVKNIYPVKSNFPVKNSSSVNKKYPVKSKNPVKNAFPVKRCMHELLKEIGDIPIAPPRVENPFISPMKNSTTAFKVHQYQPDITSDSKNHRNISTCYSRRKSSTNSRTRQYYQSMRRYAS